MYLKKLLAERCSASNTDMTCCTEDQKCSSGQGDCDIDAECQGALICGNDNCGSDFPDSSFDCCECNCYEYGSNGCNDDGICNCKTNFGGSNCNKCADGYYNFPACEGKHYFIIN